MVCICRKWLQQLWNWIGQTSGENGEQQLQQKQQQQHVWKQQQHLAPKGQDALLPFVGLPIVPLCDGGLAPLTPSHSCTLVNIRSGKAGLADASFLTTLQALGLEVLDDDSFSLPLRDRQQQKDKLLLVPGYCHSGDAAGILNALRIVALQSLTRPPASAATAATTSRATTTVFVPNRVLNEAEVLEVRLMFSRRMESLTVNQRRSLRATLLKDSELSQSMKNGGRSSDGITLKQILTWLPIYESAASAVLNDGAQSAVLALSSTQSVPTGYILPPFQDLAGALCVRKSLSELVSYFVAPQRIDPKVLSAKFLSNRHSAESRVLINFLGVSEMQPSEAYRFHILPTIAAHEPSLRDSVVLQMLHNLPNLIQNDKSFQEFVAQVSFLPNVKVRVRLRTEERTESRVR